MEITTARYINVNGSLLDLSQPRVMGILNVTPDSFYAGSRTQTEAEIVRRVRQIVSEGAAIIDIGASLPVPMPTMSPPGRRWNGCVWA